MFAGLEEDVPGVRGSDVCSADGDYGCEGFLPLGWQKAYVIGL